MVKDYFSSHNRKRTRMSAVHAPGQCGTAGPSQCEKKQIQGVQCGKEEVALFLFIDSALISIGNPKKVQEKLSELLGEFSKVVKIQGQYTKSAEFIWYTSREQLVIDNLCRNVT